MILFFFLLLFLLTSLCLVICCHLRKSSGFSRGLNRYRNLCSRWDQSLGRTSEPEYLVQYGVSDEVECGNVEGYCKERKIDLTTYIKWWCKPHQPDPVSKSSAKQVSTRMMSASN